MMLGELRARGVLEPLDTELARALCRMESRVRPAVELAIALTSRSVRRGHACLPLARPADELVEVDEEISKSFPTPDSWVEEVRESALIEEGPLVLDGQARLYLRRYWQFERDIARELRRRSERASELDPGPEWRLEALDRVFGSERASKPRLAAETALDHRVSVLCGGPGTGKTTTVAAIVALLAERRLVVQGRPPKVLLLAPTGKAAVRLAEAVSRTKASLATPEAARKSIPREATTVHRALGMHRNGMRFARDADRPIDADVIVLDEASMIDLALMRQLLVAAPDDADLVIVGDPGQLTSVEAGSVLRDLVRASDETWWRGRVTQLTKTYRYDSSEPLGELIAAVRAGEASRVAQVLSVAQSGDVARSGHHDLESALDHAALRWSETLAAADAEEHFRRRSRYVVLTPLRSGAVGTKRLAEAIASRITDLPVLPIIIEENHAELGIFNGDFGMWLRDETPEIAIVQREASTPRRIAAARLPRYSEAFALSVHKAQGSEFDEVLIILPEQDGPLLTRELLYTAISRARHRVHLVASPEVLNAAVERRAQRFSGLVDRIAEEGRLRLVGAS